MLSDQISKLAAYNTKVTLTKEGRRWYFGGNTYPIKSEIRDLGGKVGQRPGTVVDFIHHVQSKQRPGGKFGTQSTKLCDG